MKYNFNKIWTGIFRSSSSQMAHQSLQLQNMICFPQNLKSDFKGYMLIW